MKTNLPTPITPTITRAAELLKACVHCGFCTATCTSYQILGDELDSPRGRIYLIKEMIERQEATALTREHLDRCLLCRNCETTCPSGVQYADLLELGRKEVLRFAPRSWANRLLRAGLIAVLSHRTLFSGLLRIGQFFRPILPASLAHHIPPRAPVSGNFASTLALKAGLNLTGAKTSEQEIGQKIILFEGCAQPALRPNISPATTHLLVAAGYQVIRASALGCCGAIAHHLEGDAHATIKRNIDVLIPLLDAVATGVLFDASGCGLMLKDYGRLLRDDPVYAQSAERVALATHDISVWVLPHLKAVKARLKTDFNHSTRATLAYHPPCTLQHGLKQKDGVLTILQELGFTAVVPDESHLCCGSAGTYSILHPQIAGALRSRKLTHLETALNEAAANQANLDQTSLNPSPPEAIIVTANIGCIHHLQSGTTRPVHHWVEVVAEGLNEGN